MKILSQLSHESRIVKRGWLIKTIHLERLQSDKWVSVESVIKTNEVFYTTDDYVRFLLHKEYLKRA